LRYERFNKKDYGSTALMLNAMPQNTPLESFDILYFDNRIGENGKKRKYVLPLAMVCQNGCGTFEIFQAGNEKEAMLFFSKEDLRHMEIEEISYIIR
jgi:hypothetical protein